MTPDRSRRPTEARLRLYVVVFFMTAMCPPGALGQEMRVTGTVVDSITGTAIPGALVILTPPDGAAVSTASSETGEFMIGAPKLTKARISVSAMGMEAWFSEPLPEADSVDLGMIPLQADPYTLRASTSRSKHAATPPLKASWKPIASWASSGHDCTKSG